MTFSKVTQLGHGRPGIEIQTFLSLLSHIFHHTTQPLGKKEEVESETQDSKIINIEEVVIYPQGIKESMWALESDRL